MARTLIGRPCVKCGRRTTSGSRCERCAAELETERQRRQPYRAAYFSREYRAARAARLKRARGRCEAILPSRRRCGEPASETHHLVPLSKARSLAEAIALCVVGNLRAVCWRHNPRGRRSGNAA